MGHRITCRRFLCVSYLAPVLQVKSERFICDNFFYTFYTGSDITTHWIRDKLAFLWEDALGCVSSSLWTSMPQQLTLQQMFQGRLMRFRVTLLQGHLYPNCLWVPKCPNQQISKIKVVEYRTKRTTEKGRRRGRSGKEQVVLFFLGLNILMYDYQL